MKKVLLTLTVSGFTLGMATSVLAQAVTPTPPPAPAAIPTVIGGTGLSTGAAGGLLAVAGVLLIASGGDGGVVTTTTTTGN